MEHSNSCNFRGLRLIKLIGDNIQDTRYSIVERRDVQNGNKFSIVGCIVVFFCDNLYDIIVGPTLLKMLFINENYKIT